MDGSGGGLRGNRAGVARARWSGRVLRVAGYAGIWWILTEGDPGAWWWGVPAILAAAWLNPFAPGWTGGWRIRGIIAFVPVFLFFSLRSALDVAWRAVHPRCPLEPALLDYPWALPAGTPRLLFANLVNLMPGTLCVRISEQAITLHVLARPRRTQDMLERLEGHVMNMFQPESPND